MQAMSSGIQLSEQSINKPPKSKEDYSRNVKKLKIKLKNISEEIIGLQKKIDIFKNTSNDKMIALKLSKFCRERKMTPQMLFRFADRSSKRKISRENLNQTFTAIGLKFTQDQMKRFQYLIDEDLSGDITWDQYNRYLYAFGVKGEYSPDDNFLKDALKKLDINKILGLAEDQKKKKRTGEDKHRQLLNYEQFMKYCHRHFPGLKNKEIAVIFNRLEKNGLIDLQDFLDYIKQKDEQEKKLKDKNKKSKDKQDVEEVDQSKTLKGIIKSLLKYRPKDSKSLFHSSQFQRLQKILQKPKGQIIQLFRQIDKKKRGSFGFNELIQYYVTKCEKPNLIFTYELMGKKISITGNKPQDTLRQYNGSNQTVSIKQFTNFCQKQFQITEKEAEQLYRLVAKQQNTIPIRVILDAMKLEQGQKKMVYIKPTMWDTGKNDFFRKNSSTIFFNPFVALRSCISIMQELSKVKQHFWDDFQFGPTFQDAVGIYSIGLSVSQDNVKWNTTNSLGMDQFYYPTSENKFKSTGLCSHDIFQKSLGMLVQQSQQFLWNKQKIDYNIKNVQEKDLQVLFHGIYPLVFHSFAKYGVYVFKFFIRQRWAYVLIDNKIPCNSDNEPLFSSCQNGKLSWVSLIEKAYAKIKGSYERIFQPATSKHYIYELNRSVPLQTNIQPNLNTKEKKDSIWNNLCQTINYQSNKCFSLTTDQGATQLIQNNKETGLIKNMPYPILNTLQLKDSTCNNDHKSHRLVFFKDLILKNQGKWNQNWHIENEKNKVDKYQTQIQAELKKKGQNISLSKDKNLTILNYKLFRGIFNKIISLHHIQFSKIIVLRKIVEFQEKFSCQYEISCTEKQPGCKVRILVVLNRIKSPEDTIIQLKLSDSKKIEISKSQIKNIFGSQQFIVPSQNHYLDIRVTNWKNGQDHAYSLTFYILNPKYHLKQLDRQLLFKFVSPYEEAHHLDIKRCNDKERKFIYRNFYRAAQRSATCCG